MPQISIPTTEKPSVIASKTAKAARFFFVDHLRAVLIITVVLHHVGLVYGAGAPFYYVEPPLTDPLAFKLLLVFALFNQGWNMGAFFLLAGYFTPRSYDRRGAGAFLGRRLIRLGIPILLFAYILNPISSLGYWQMPAALTGITSQLSWETFWQAYPDTVGLGPIWFITMLLIFSFGYVVWRMLGGNKAPTTANQFKQPSYLLIGGFIVVLALVSYLLRIVIPMDKAVVDFPTLAYLPQYLSFFVIGAIASRQDWLRRLPGSKGAVGMLTALAAAVLLFPLAVSGRFFSLDFVDPARFVGNGTWESAVYALWDSIFAVGLTIGFITLFRHFLAGKSRFGSFLSEQSYAVYIFHTPIVVLIAVLLKDVQLAPLPKFGLAALIIVPVCFIVAALIRRIPGVAKVI